MKKGIISLFITTVVLTLVILSSCNEPNVIENKKIEKQEKPLLKKRTIKRNNSVADVSITGKLLGYNLIGYP